MVVSDGSIVFDVGHVRRQTPFLRCHAVGSHADFGLN